jgi:hypothetical protein
VDEQELAELQDPRNWEDTDDEIRPPVKAPRAVVSVAFARDDFLRVTEQARRLGMKTSEFIRKAALDQVDPRGGHSVVRSVSGNVQTKNVSAIATGPKSRVRTPAPPTYGTS